MSVFTKPKTWTRRSADADPTPQEKWNARNRFKLRAHAAVREALREGTLKRGRCEECSSFRVEAHHDDYNRPLTVRWFCHRHHQRLHALLRRAA